MLNNLNLNKGDLVYLRQEQQIQCAIDFTNEKKRCTILTDKVIIFLQNVNWLGIEEQDSCFIIALSTTLGVIKVHKYYIHQELTGFI